MHRIAIDAKLIEVRSVLGELAKSLERRDESLTKDLIAAKLWAMDWVLTEAQHLLRSAPVPFVGPGSDGPSASGG
jgi:hypothetical protein